MIDAAAIGGDDGICGMVKHHRVGFAQGVFEAVTQIKNIRFPFIHAGHLLLRLGDRFFGGDEQHAFQWRQAEAVQEEADFGFLARGLFRLSDQGDLAGHLIDLVEIASLADAVPEEGYVVIGDLAVDRTIAVMPIAGVFHCGIDQEKCLIVAGLADLAEDRTPLLISLAVGADLDPAIALLERLEQPLEGCFMEGLAVASGHFGIFLSIKMCGRIIQEVYSAAGSGKLLQQFEGSRTNSLHWRQNDGAIACHADLESRSLVPEFLLRKGCSH